MYLFFSYSDWHRALNAIYITSVYSYRGYRRLILRSVRPFFCTYGVWLLKACTASSSVSYATRLASEPLPRNWGGRSLCRRRAVPYYLWYLSCTSRSRWDPWPRISPQDLIIIQIRSTTLNTTWQRSLIRLILPIFSRLQSLQKRFLLTLLRIWRGKFSALISFEW